VQDAFVARVLPAPVAAAPAGAQWNWAAEERAIRDMVRSARAKGFAGAGRGATVHDLKEERAKREARPPRDGKSATVAVGKAVIGVWNERYGPVMHTGGATYAYEGGIWLVWDEALAQRLRAIVQEACAALGLEPRTSLLAAARAYFMDRPELYRDDVTFDAHGLLVAEDGALDFASREVREHAPEHHARFKVAACLKGPRDCPAWLGFLDNVFADRACADEIVATLQEWFGASIAVTRARPLLKGLLAHGASRTGKTQVSEVMRGLLGERHVCNARMRDLEGRFGLEPLIGKRGWIADDAIGVKEYLDAETYKVVVTGERTSAQTKGGKNVEVRFGFPVLLTANNLPRVNDKSDATYNRSLILPMTRVRPEDAPEPPGYDSIARKVIAEELTGVLWWAIEGRARLFARGRYAPPSAMLEAGRSFQDSNDPVGSWMRQCIEPCTRTKVARKDLASSFNGWWQLESDDGKRFSANAITREIKARFPSIAEIKTQGERFFGGIRLNEDGLFAWETRTKGYDSGGKAYSAAPEDVNRHWEQAVLLKGGGDAG
jgi:P4 family phage/plasmid primase-like protien